MAADSIAPVSMRASALSSPAIGGGHGKPTNAKEAATQFEGMLIGEMLRSVHDSNSGSLDGDEDSDSESDTTYSMAADQFAQLMAKQGGFGVAKLLTQGLASREGGVANAKSGDAHLGELHPDRPNPL
jgi:Rod binding domain-containing protein